MEQCKNFFRLFFIHRVFKKCLVLYQLKEKSTQYFYLRLKLHFNNTYQKVNVLWRKLISIQRGTMAQIGSEVNWKNPCVISQIPGQIRENFFHIVSYFLGFFCMAGFSFSTSRVASEAPLSLSQPQPSYSAFSKRFQRSSKTITMKTRLVLSLMTSD